MLNSPSSYKRASQILIFIAALSVSICSLFITIDVISAESKPSRVLSYSTVFLVGLLTAMGLNPAALSIIAIPAVGAVFNPILVGGVAAFGSAIGETSGYAIGYGSRGLVSDLPGQNTWQARLYNRLFSWRAFAWLESRILGWVAKHPFLTLFCFAAIPNIFLDFAGMIAGRSGYPYPKFFFATFLGKAIRFSLYAYLGTWAFPLVKS